MGKLARRFLGRLGALADSLLTDWLLLFGLTEVPRVERGETLCDESLSINNQTIMVLEMTKKQNILHPSDTEEPMNVDQVEHLLLLLPTVTLTGIGMGTVGYSNFTSVSAG